MVYMIQCFTLAFKVDSLSPDILLTFEKVQELQEVIWDLSWEILVLVDQQLIFVPVQLPYFEVSSCPFLSIWDLILPSSFRLVCWLHLLCNEVFWPKSLSLLCILRYGPYKCFQLSPFRLKVHAQWDKESANLFHMSLISAQTMKAKVEPSLVWEAVDLNAWPNLVVLLS